MNSSKDKFEDFLKNDFPDIVKKSKEEEKVWKSDDFCCREMELNITREYICVSGFSSPEAPFLEIGLWNGYFGKDKSVCGAAMLKYCLSCGKQMTPEFVKNLVDKYTLRHPSRKSVHLKKE